MVCCKKQTKTINYLFYEYKIAFIYPSYSLEKDIIKALIL